ncbi:Haloacid dehalogenase-like hydrolase domain-containing protein 2 [Lamellibrachia satsuma]|nr:Haloacid dehalogenase-like hydrolase domain-containing protein 2 [Lamellibrachia satsuma]
MNRRVTAALVDLSGTIHIDNTAIKGAKEALDKLTKAGIKVKYVTNTTKEPLRLLHQKLTSLGFEIDRSEIFTSLSAARQLVETKQVRPFLLLEDSAKEDFKGITEEDPNAVVVGLAPSCFNYNYMNQAFRLLMDGAPLIAIHKARYYKKADSLYLGPGPFVQGLEYATGATAEVVGKPEKTFFHEAIQNLDVSPHNAVMIGDDARDDVSGAINAGMLGILVQTGKYREGDETKFSPRPTAVCPDIAAAVDYILEHCV